MKAGKKHLKRSKSYKSRACKQHQGHTPFGGEGSDSVCNTKAARKQLLHSDWSCYNSCCSLVLHPASQWAEISGMTGISIHSIKKRRQ